MIFTNMEHLKYIPSKQFSLEFYASFKQQELLSPGNTIKFLYVLVKYIEQIVAERSR